MIEIKNLSKKFKVKGLDDLQLFNNLNLNVREGDYISIMGTSGVGKTTLLNIIGLVETFDSGNYLIDGKEVKKIKDSRLSNLLGSKFSYIFQEFFC